MAKKSSKHQSKLANTATADTAITEEPASTETTAAPATTQIPFFDFITLATTEDVKIFLKLANTTPEGKNLEYLWRRAYREGYEKGKKVALKGLETETKDKFREGIAKGMNLVREQGYTVAKEAFDEIIKKVKAREASESKLANAITQTDLMPITTTSIFTQNDSTADTPCQSEDIFIPTTLTTTVGIQANTVTFPAISEAPTFVENGVRARFTPTVNSSLQTSPHVVYEPSLATIGTQTEATTSQHLGISNITCVTTSQSPALYANEENAKISSTLAGKNPPYIEVFSSPTPYTTLSDSSACSTTIPALETRPTTIGFAQKLEKLEKLESSPILSQNTTTNLPPCTVEHTNDVGQAHTSQRMLNNVVSRLPSLSTTATSLSIPYPTSLEKSGLSRAAFEAQPPTESPVFSSTVRAPKTRPELSSFIENYKKVEKSPLSTQIIPQTTATGIVGPTDDITRVCTSAATSNDVILQPPATPTTASSQPKVVTLHQKSEQLGVAFESQSSPGSPEPSYIVSALKTRPTSPGFTKKDQKTEKPLIFTQNSPEPPVSTHFDWADDAKDLSTSFIVPTKYPRDLSGLRSSSTNPFSSLRRRCRNRKKPQRFIGFRAQSDHLYTFPSFCHHIPAQHSLCHSSQPPVVISLDWDQDPRLADLSNTLRALSWARR